MRQGVKYAAVLIGVYLGVVYFEGSTGLVSSGGNAISNIVAAFQGRAAGTSTKAQ